MTGRMLHLTMWYAGHDPRSAWRAALEQREAWSDYNLPAAILSHYHDFYVARVEQHR